MPCTPAYTVQLSLPRMARIALFWLSFFFAIAPSVMAYLPASPMNATENPTNSNSDTSFLTLRWEPGGLFTNSISSLLTVPGSDGAFQGAFVDFSDDDFTNTSTTTPWIAFINCDSNVTYDLPDIDTFTAARDSGALAAVLYSVWSDFCVINPTFSRSPPPLDIYTSPSAKSSALVRSLFTNINQTLYSAFDPLTLNQSAAAIAAEFNGSNTDPTYLLALIRPNSSSVSIPSSNSTHNGETPLASFSNTLFALTLLLPLVLFV